MMQLHRLCTFFGAFSLCSASALSGAAPCTDINGALDTDCDGRADAADAEPCDPKIAEKFFARGVLHFEDVVDAEGSDRDFGDLVANYKVVQHNNDAGETLALEYGFRIEAADAALANALGVALEASLAAHPATVTRTILKADNTALEKDAVRTPWSLGATAQAANRDFAVTVAQPGEAFEGAPAGTKAANADPDQPYYEPLRIKLRIQFDGPLYPTLDASQLPYDIFLHGQGAERTVRQVHRVAYGGARTNNNIPYALEIPVESDEYPGHPANNQSIEALFPKIIDWARSSGLSFTNFASATHRAAGKGYFARKSRARPTRSHSQPGAEGRCLPNVSGTLGSDIAVAAAQPLRQNDGTHNSSGLLSLLDEVAAELQALGRAESRVAVGSSGRPACASAQDVGRIYYEPSGSDPGLYSCQAVSGGHQYKRL